MILLAAMAVIFSGCVKDLEKYGFVESTTLKGRVIADNNPISGINVSVTNGSSVFTSCVTGKDGLFVLDVNYNQIGNDYYLLLDGQGKNMEYELKGMGQKVYDYRDLILYENPYTKLPTFDYGGHTYKVAPDPGNFMEWDYANSYCQNLSLYGVSGWKMPTRDELVQMYSMKITIGGFSSFNYWASTPYKDSYYGVNFSNGVVNHYYSKSEMRVRPIRVEK